MPADLPPTLDPSAAARWLRSPPAASSPWLHEEVARRMEQRLEWIVARPARWVDWHPLRGGMEAHRLVARRFPDAECEVVEATADQAARAAEALAAPWWRRLRGGPSVRFRTDAEGPAEGAAGMLWANMALHAAADPQSLIVRWHRALATDGYLMFSCLGPDSLRELHGLYAALGWPPAGSAFTDMHDWGDMLVHAGFAEPVMDMERIVLSYETAEKLLDDLRQLGRNFHPARFPALRGRAFRRRLLDGLTERLASPHDGGRLVLTFEIVYGHAFKPVPRARLAAESTVALGDMRSMLRRGRPGA